MGFVKELREFAARGNVVDMAVGVIVGAAFGKIVSSFVGDVMMPPLGILTGGMDFSRMGIELRAAAGAEPAVVLGYGKLMQAVVDFGIVTMAVFALVKAVNALKRKQDAAPAAPPPPPRSDVLLEEIRDLLRARA